MPTRHSKGQHRRRNCALLTRHSLLFLLALGVIHLLLLRSTHSALPPLIPLTNNKMSSPAPLAAAANGAAPLESVPEFVQRTKQAALDHLAGKTPGSNVLLIMGNTAGGACLSLASSLSYRS